MQPGSWRASGAEFAAALVGSLEGLLGPVRCCGGLQHDAANRAVDLQPELLIEQVEIASRVNLASCALCANPHQLASVLLRGRSSTGHTGGGRCPLQFVTLALDTRCESEA